MAQPEPDALTPTSVPSYSPAQRCPQQPGRPPRHAPFSLSWFHSLVPSLCNQKDPKSSLCFYKGWRELGLLPSLCSAFLCTLPQAHDPICLPNLSSHSLHRAFALALTHAGKYATSSDCEA